MSGLGEGQEENHYSRGWEILSANILRQMGEIESLYRKAPECIRFEMSFFCLLALSLFIYFFYNFYCRVSKINVALFYGVEIFLKN